MSPWTKSPARTVIPYQPSFFPRVLGSCMSRIFPATRKMIPNGKYLWEHKRRVPGQVGAELHLLGHLHILFCFDSGIIDSPDNFVIFISWSGWQGSRFAREPWDIIAPPPRPTPRMRSWERPACQVSPLIPTEQGLEVLEVRHLRTL